MKQDNMKATVVPNRNKIFSSLIQSVALSIANKTESPVKIAMGIHAGDFMPCILIVDKNLEMQTIMLLLEGNWDAERVESYTPYLEVMIR